MKRKKPPIALISFLVVSILGLVIFSKSFAFFNLSQQDQMTQLQQEAEERAKSQTSPPPGAKPDATREVNAMKSAMKLNTKKELGKPESAPIPGRPGGAPGGGATVPTVVLPSDIIQKPQPNTAATSSQWYDNK